MISVDDLKKRVAGNLKVLKKIDWAKEAKLATGLEKRPRVLSPYEQGEATLQRWKRNAEYSGPSDPPSPKEIKRLVASTPKGPEHKFNSGAHLDTSSIVDGGTGNEIDQFVARLNYIAPRMLIPDPLGAQGNYELPAWRSVLEAGKLVPRHQRMLEGPEGVQPEQALGHSFQTPQGRLQKQRQKG